MVKRPVEVQRDIEEQRRRVADKLIGLRERLQEDAGKTKSAWKRQSSRAGLKARRSLVYSAGALGLALALGAGYATLRRAVRKKRDNIIPLEVRIKQ